jgi:hypothetical protein
MPFLHTYLSLSDKPMNKVPEFLMRIRQAYFTCNYELITNNADIIHGQMSISS